MGRQIRNEENIRTNIYAIGIAPSGAGKEYPRKVLRRIFSESGGQKYLGGEGIASDAGLVAALQDHPSKIYMLDEFGKMLSAFTRNDSPKYLKGIVTEILTIYSGSDSVYYGKDYADRERKPQIIITDPCLNIWGISTPEAFFNALTGENILDGFLNRFSLFISHSTPRLRHFKNILPIPEHIIEFFKKYVSDFSSYEPNIPLHQITGKTHQLTTLSYTDQAHSYLVKKLSEEIYQYEKNSDPHLKPLWVRTEEQAIKYSLILAASQDKKEVEQSDIQYGGELAVFLAKHAIESVDKFISDNLFQKEVKKIRRIIRDARKRGISSSALTRKTQSLTKKQRMEVLEVLFESEEIALKSERTAGKSKNVYFAI